MHILYFLSDYIFLIISQAVQSNLMHIQWEVQVVYDFYKIYYVFKLGAFKKNNICLICNVKYLGHL